MNEEELRQFKYATYALEIIENYSYALELCRAQNKTFDFKNQHIRQPKTYYHSLIIDVDNGPEQLISIYQNGSSRISGYDRKCGGIANTDTYYFVFDTTGKMSYDSIEINAKFKPFTLTEEEHFQYSLIYDLKSFEYYKAWSELFEKYHVPDEYVAYWYYHPTYSLDKLEDINVNIKNYMESLC